MCSEENINFDVENNNNSTKNKPFLETFESIFNYYMYFKIQYMMCRIKLTISFVVHSNFKKIVIVR